MKKLINIILISLLIVAFSCTQPQADIVIDGKNVTEYKYSPSEYNNLCIYQIMVESFIDGDPDHDYGDGYGTSHHSGDLRGVINALPYIKSLGVNAIWLTPIFDSERGTPSYGPDADPEVKLDATGYFPRNYFKIDPCFGTIEDAREMVNKAHELGLYVFFDGVFGHNKGKVPPSPKGNKVYGNRLHADFPESLPFFKEVATYWIDELEIDGWRLDQSYQLPIEVWREIDDAVKEKCKQRKKTGKKWGILGYMVGEVWEKSDIIAAKAYGTDENPGLISAFDFPVRYKLAQVLAVEEKGFGKQPVSVLKEGLMTHYKYPKFAIPNLMLTNHDLVRFGDLIQRAGLPGTESENYWKRHKCAFGFIAAYTGPITFYYGDEYGDEVEGFVEKIDDPEEECWKKGLCDDHVSRNSGKISGFNEKQKDLQKYLYKLMKMRKDHSVLWNGKTTNLLAETDVYIDLKWSDAKNKENILYVLNTSNKTKTIKISGKLLKGEKMSSLLSKNTISKNRDDFIFTINPLSTAFYKIEK